MQLPRKRPHKEAERETFPCKGKVKVLYRRDVSKPFPSPAKTTSSGLPPKALPKLPLSSYSAGHEPYDIAKVRYMYGSPAPKVYSRPVYATPKGSQQVACLREADLDTFESAAEGVMSPVKPIGTESEGKRTAPSTPIFGGTRLSGEGIGHWPQDPAKIKPFTAV